MQTVFHLGAHCTDEDRLLRGLLRDRGWLAEERVVVPAPARYRPMLRQTLGQLKGAPASAAVQEALLDALTETDEVRRLVVSYADLLSLPGRVISDQGLYAAAGPQAAGLANLFPEAETEFFLAICNPATQIPLLVARDQTAEYSAFMSDQDPLRLSWVPVVQALRQAVPDARLVVWCNEDSPLLWPELLQELAGVGSDRRMAGRTDLPDQIIGPAGAARLATFLERHPPRSAEAMRRILAAFLERFAAPRALTVEAALPGWDEALVDELTAAYDRDLEMIAGIEGVELLLP